MFISYKANISNRSYYNNSPTYFIRGMASVTIAKVEAFNIATLKPCKALKTIKLSTKLDIDTPKDPSISNIKPK